MLGEAATGCVSLPCVLLSKGSLSLSRCSVSQGVVSSKVTGYNLYFDQLDKNNVAVVNL